MSDHVNISAPDPLGADGSRFRDRLRVLQLEAELGLVRQHLEKATSDLSSIFTRIARGDPVELHYPDGTVIPITKARPRRSGEGD